MYKWSVVTYVTHIQFNYIYMGYDNSTIKHNFYVPKKPLSFLKEKPMYRLKYQYDLLEVILNKSRTAIRQDMRRKGLGNTAEDFAMYLKSMK